MPALRKPHLSPRGPRIMAALRRVLLSGLSRSLAHSSRDLPGCRSCARATRGKEAGTKMAARMSQSNRGRNMMSVLHCRSAADSLVSTDWRGLLPLFVLFAGDLFKRFFGGSFVSWIFAGVAANSSSSITSFRFAFGPILGQCQQRPDNGHLLAPGSVGLLCGSRTQELARGIRLRVLIDKNLWIIEVFHQNVDSPIRDTRSSGGFLRERRPHTDQTRFLFCFIQNRSNSGTRPAFCKSGMNCNAQTTLWRTCQFCLRLSESSPQGR